ncbi:hypothetical protein V1291_000071 [Nitrobacteraceae bacterium AZCC 1564]
MNLAAREVIANVKARDPAQSKDGPVLGPVIASDVAEALSAAGYVLVHQSQLAELRAGAETVLKFLGHGIKEDRPARS